MKMKMQGTYGPLRDLCRYYKMILVSPSECKTNLITLIMLLKWMHNCLLANVFQVSSNPLQMK